MTIARDPLSQRGIYRNPVFWNYPIRKAGLALLYAVFTLAHPVLSPKHPNIWPAVEDSLQIAASPYQSTGKIYVRFVLLMIQDQVDLQPALFLH